MEEELEALNHRMMQSDDEGDQMYPESQNFNNTYGNRKFESTQDLTPERTYIKIQVF